MLITIIGESCTGKSTLAEKVNKDLNAEIISGKDYLRMAKSESEATSLFKEKLSQAVAGQSDIIYVITEKPHLDLIPEGGVKVLATSELDVIKERFAKRMRGNLPKPVEQMIERKHGMFDEIDCDLKVTVNDETIDEVCRKLITLK